MGEDECQWPERGLVYLTLLPVAKLGLGRAIGGRVEVMPDAVEDNQVEERDKLRDDDEDRVE